jgi:hypothetical protein
VRKIRKSIKSIPLVLALAVLALSSCNKNAPLPAVKSSVAFQFNGTPRSTSNVIATNYITQNSLEIIGQISSTEQIILQFDTLKTGTFNVATNGVVLGYSPDNIAADACFGATGTITLSSFVGTTATGTFSVTAKNSLNVDGVITQGTFSAQYTKQ